MLLDMLFAPTESTRLRDRHAPSLPRNVPDWLEIEARYDTKIEKTGGAGRGRPVETKPDLYLANAKLAPLVRALLELDCRYHGHPPRPVPDARGRAEWLDEQHELWKANPLADWRDATAGIVRERGFRTTRCTTGVTTRLATRTPPLPGKGREGRWAGTERTECGLHTRGRDKPGFRPLVHGPVGRGEDDDCEYRRSRSLSAAASPSSISTATSSARTSRRASASRRRTATSTSPAWAGSPHASHRAGAAVVVSAISPYEEMREARARARRAARSVRRDLRRDARSRSARAATRKVSTPQAFAGEIEEFTGVSAPYEEPLDPEVRLETAGRTPPEAATVVIARLEELNLIPAEVEAERGDAQRSASDFRGNEVELLEPRDHEAPPRAACGRRSRAGAPGRAAPRTAPRHR